MPTIVNRSKIDVSMPDRSNRYPPSVSTLPLYGRPD
jgi:hypothetical protein